MRFLVALILVQSFAFGQLDEITPIVGLQVMDAEVAVDLWKESGLPQRLAPKRGLLITWVPPGSVADRNGIKEMDLLDKLNNKQVRNLKELKDALAKSSPGELVPITIRRQAGTGWHPIKGEILCSSPRLNAYAQMTKVGSQVTGSSFVRHAAFKNVLDLIAPVILVIDQKPQLYLEVKTANEDWLFMEELTIQFDGKSVKILVNDRIDDVADSRPMCRERCVRAMPKDLEALLVTDAKKRLFRLDGKTSYREAELSLAWAEHVKTTIAVYQDMVETGNLDLTLGGKIK